MIQYNVSEERLRRNVEPVMHIFSVSFGLLTSLSALLMDLYNNADLWCWIAAYPSGCEGDECIRGRDDFETFRWAFFFVPLWVCAFFITIVMVSIYRTVRKREVLANADSEREGGGRRNSLIRPSLTKAASRKTFLFGNPLLRFSVFAGDHSPDSTQKPEQAESPRQNRRRPTKPAERPSLHGASLTPAQRPSMVLPRKVADMFKSMTATGFQTNDESDADFVLKTIETLPSAKEQAAEVHTFGSRAVYMQALYYTCAFYITYTFATVNRLVQQFTGNTYFPIIFLHVCLIPLQGLFNRKFDALFFHFWRSIGNQTEIFRFFSNSHGVSILLL